MEETIINNKKYLTAKRTAYILGCTNDYVSKLCREGKLECLRQDKLWLVEEYSALNYHQSVEVKKSKNRTELAEERAQEYQRSQERLRVQNVQRYIKRVSSLVGIAVMTGLMFFGSQTEIFARTGLAEVAEKVGENISHNFNQAKSVAAVVIGRRVDGVEERYVASIYRAADQIVGAPERFINSVQHVERGIASVGNVSEKVATNIFEKVSNPVFSGARNTASVASSIGNLYMRGINSVANFLKSVSSHSP